MKRFLSLLIACLLAFPLGGLAANRGVYYEVFIRAYADSDGDGVGDLKGLMAKLPYLKDLGVSGLWLMPLFPTTTYHGYDVTDYRSINPEYGTMDDFRALLQAAHENGISVLLDIPFNHTSSKHPWFIESMDKNSPKRSWYHWANERMEGVHLDKKVWNENVWKKLGSSYYYALFWEGMPDLNFNNEEVRKEVIDISLYWLSMGVDGFRLDATSHIYAEGEESGFQDVDKSADFWAEYYAAVKKEFPSCYIIGEAWEPLPKRAKLMRGLDSAVNFDVGDRLFPLLKSGGLGVGFTREMLKSYAAYNEIRSPHIDAPFLTNHDQNRAFGMAGYKKDRARLAMQVLLTLPGNPFLYYGEEIGMSGAKPDEELRTPMLWGDDGMMANWHASKYNKKTIALDQQVQDPDSLFNAYKRWIALRNEHEALRLGQMRETTEAGDQPIAFHMVSENETLLVLHNPRMEEIQGTLQTAYRVVYQDAGCLLEGKTYTLAPYSSMLLEIQP